MLPSSTSTWNPPISFEEVAECFTLPIVEASARLGICSTTLKRMCREHGIPRWPYRKVMAGKSIEEIKREAVGQQAAEDGYVGGNSFMVGSYEHEELSRVKNSSEDGRWKGVQHTASSNVLWSPAAPISLHSRSSRDCLPAQSTQGHSVAAAWRPGSSGETPLDKAKGASIDSIQQPAGAPLLYPPQGTLPGLSLPFPSGPPHVGSPHFSSTFSNYEIPATSSSTPFDGARPSPLGFGNNHLSVGYPQLGMPRLTHKWWRKSNAGRKNLQDVKERASSEGAGRPGEATDSQPQDLEGGGARGGDREPDSTLEKAKSSAPVASAPGQRKDSSSLRASHIAASLWRKRKERAASQARTRDSRLAVYRGYGQPLREGDLDVLKLVFGKFGPRDWEDLGARRVISEQ